MSGQWEDPSAHLTSDFAAAFPAWGDLRYYIDRHQALPELGTHRLLQQILSADFAQRLAAVEAHDWLLMGSLSLPPRAADDRWRADVRRDGVHPSYTTARAAFDLDLCARDLTDADPEQAARLYGTTVERLVKTVAAPTEEPGTAHGLGLGGLVRYSISHLTVHPNGQIMGVVSAQPRDTHLAFRTTIPVDDPIGVESDIKPPAKARFDGPAESSQRSMVAIEVPGMAVYRPALFPTANQLADKICLLAGPPASMRPNSPTGPWHRYKDLLDCYYLIQYSRIRVADMQTALTSNWNLARTGLSELPTPYRVYGNGPNAEPRVGLSERRRI